MNFTPIGFVEPFDLICSLKGRMGLFAGTGLRLLHLRGPRKGGEDYVDTRELTRWPEIRAVLDSVATVGQQRFSTIIEFGRVYLEMLDAGSSTAARRTLGNYGLSHMRLVLGLRSNPAAYLWCPPHQHILTPGELVLTAPALWHGAVNMGEYSRINLVIDVRGSGPITLAEKEDADDLPSEQFILDNEC